MRSGVRVLVVCGLAALFMGCGPSFRDVYPRSPHPRAYEWYLRAQVFEARGHYDEAERMINRALLMDPESAALKIERADILRQGGRVEEALATLAPLIEAAPAPAALLVRARCERDQGDLEAALATTRRGLSSGPRASALGLRSLEADVATALGLTDDARASLSALVEAAPTYASGWQRLGMLALDEGRHGDAIDALERALSLSATDPAPFLALAQAYRAQGDDAHAREVLQRCVDAALLSPDCREALRRDEREAGAALGRPARRRVGAAHTIGVR